MQYAPFLNLSAYFYDKVADLLTATKTITTDGQVTESATKVGTITGNLQFSMSEQLQKQYGLKDSYSIYITTKNTATMGQFIEYQGLRYKIIEVIKRDTHNLITANNVSVN